MRTKCLSAAISMAVVCVWSSAAEQPKVPDLAKTVSVHEGTLDVDAGQSWSTPVTVPELADDEAPVLSVHGHTSAGGGGCNWIMQVLVNDAPLTESFMRRRLLNKRPWFDPPGTKYHFSWYDSRRSVWMR